jgi:DNA primase
MPLGWLIVRGVIPQEIIEEVRVRSDIVQVISEYVPLKRKGKNYIGYCPFHQEKTASFSVNREKQIFHCFGCHTGGDIFRFLMLQEAISFPEAVRKLAQTLNIDLPVELDPKSLDEKRKRQAAWEINDLAKNFYNYVLLNHKIAQPARDYLVKRGISHDIAQSFELGYAPPRWDSLALYLQKKHGIDYEKMLELGLCAVNKSGRRYDRFRHRLIFPIINETGKTIGFGGRALDETDNPKYLNSPETKYFNKGQTLYGLHLARQGIREKGFAIVMEGYMDVVTAHFAGIKNAVASLGTSLTLEQGKLLMRYTTDVILAYDSDQAGIRATLRALDILQKLGFNVRVVTVPDGKDPDGFIRMAGTGAFENLIEKALDLVEYKLWQFENSVGHNLSFADKMNAVQTILPNLNYMYSAVEREEAAKKAASLLKISWEAIYSDFLRYKKNTEKNQQTRTNYDKNVNNKHNLINHGQNKMDAVEKAEQGLLILALENPSWVETIKKGLGEVFFSNKEYQKIFDLLLRESTKNDYQASCLFSFLDDREQNILSYLLSKKIPGDNLVQIISDFIITVKRSIYKEQHELLLKKLAEAEKNNDRESLSQILQELQKSY